MKYQLLRTLFEQQQKIYATIAKIPFHGEESLDSVIKTLILNATVKFTLRSKKFDVPVI